MITSYKIHDDFEWVMVKCVTITPKEEKRICCSNKRIKFSPESKKIIDETNRLYMTPKLSDEKIICYVPVLWGENEVNNYIVALLQEIKMNKDECKNAKTKEEIKKQFTLEILLIRK